jgi:hypothetical protein
MDGCSITRVFLESLSTAELVRLADWHGIDIPPDLDRVFIVEELLEAAGEDAPEEEELLPELPCAPAFPEPVPLPKQYNINFIEVMIRDPLWVFVFWEIKGSDRELYERSPDFSGYFLRASPCKTGERRAGAEDPFAFTVLIGPEDNARYLGFPPSWNSGAGAGGDLLSGKPGGVRCKIELGVCRGEEEIVLVLSRPFTLPPLLEVPVRMKEPEGIYRNPLAQLSGIGEFPVLHSIDRISRVKNRKMGVS